MGKLLDGFPWWSQQFDPDPRTGRPDIFASTDCGEETVSIWIAGRTKKYTDAADLRRMLKGDRIDGRTTSEDLAYLLNEHGLPSAPVQAPVHNLRLSLRHEIDMGLPAAVLGNFLLPTELHWLLMVGYGNNAMIAMEPWWGKLTAYRWDTVYSVATGDYVREASST